ncbi:MAG: TetM/TetW/TetO/TetS family tetracycline resistance ribosomal protection protein [Blautia sp.]|nr:TetM/TetW/TetO/TetS family tetracycline resistance ribosomal protection protein [Blautia sp.]
MRNNQLVIGICAHVDAGKTTLAEGMLYTCGELRKLGRVDHKDAFLDNFSLERARGITIFSKQARLNWEGLDITLLDTPGHVDFSAEMERTLQVMDYCILVISGADGVQGHVQTLWKLLRQYGIPVFLFVNKMDQPGTDRDALLRELQRKLDGGCVEFYADILEENREYSEEYAGNNSDISERSRRQREKDLENLAMCSEELMEEYLERGTLSPKSVAGAIHGRKIFPCFFGAALHLQGVEDLLRGIRRFALIPAYGEAFGARVYKISRDASGNRLTHLKVTGGTLKVKMTVDNRASAASEEDIREEKADQIRIYNGAGFEAAECVEAGGVCAVTGFKSTFVGQGLGFEGGSSQPVLVPVLTYQLILPEGADVVKVLGQLHQLEEEEPLLHVVWKESLGEIHVQVMGEVQIEVLKSLLQERFGLEAEFGNGSIMYKETIASVAEGIGHFEPLRHYAEVHLLLEPGEPGSGLQFASACSVDELDLNWQRLVLTHLEEKIHPGVLTGSPITDMRITLIAGRAHLKHTEGGDFRQATYRALRQGLMQCQSVLLEPVFSYTLEVPTEQLGRAMSDIQRMHGSFDSPVTEGENSVLKGSVPVAAAGDYQKEVSAYTRGHGRFSCVLKGYEPCHNTEEVLARIGYDPDGDLENPASSVFCAHGAGFLVDWQQVPEYAHVESGKFLAGGAMQIADLMRTEDAAWPEKKTEGSNAAEAIGRRPKTKQKKNGSGSDYITQEEIEEIFQRTYGKGRQDYEPYRYHGRNTGSIVYGEQENGVKNSHPVEKEPKLHAMEAKEEYFLVDGYNIIFAWEDLRSLSEVNIDSARDRLMDICCNFQGYLGATLILVFDAYKVKGNPGSVIKYHNIHVVYTKEAETADQYIEKTVHRIAKKAKVTVATSDRLEQMIIWGEGALRLSAQGFRDAVEDARRRIREEYPVKGKVFHKIQVPGTEEQGESGSL